MLRNLFGFFMIIPDFSTHLENKLMLANDY